MNMQEAPLPTRAAEGTSQRLRPVKGWPGCQNSAVRKLHVFVFKPRWFKWVHKARQTSVGSSLCSLLSEPQAELARQSLPYPKRRALRCAQPPAKRQAHSLCLSSPKPEAAPRPFFSLSSKENTFLPLIWYLNRAQVWDEGRGEKGSRGFLSAHPLCPAIGLNVPLSVSLPFSFLSPSCASSLCVPATTYPFRGLAAAWSKVFIDPSQMMLVSSLVDVLLLSSNVLSWLMTGRGTALRDLESVGFGERNQEFMALVTFLGFCTLHGILWPLYWQFQNQYITCPMEWPTCKQRGGVVEGSWIILFWDQPL